MSAFRALVALILSILLAMCGRDARADHPHDGTGTRPRFAYEGYEEALGSVSWVDLGKELAELQPLLARDLAAARPSERIAPLSRQVVQRMELLRKAGIGGSGPHGVFTHPAVLVNAIHFTLDEADRPLTGHQAEELYLLGSQFVAEETRREKADSLETMALARLVEEAELKGRMLTWVRASLTPRQQSLLQTEQTRGVVGWSFFDACSVLGPHARALAYSSRAQLLDELVRDRIEVLGLDAAEAVIVRAHISRFVSELPDAAPQGGALPRAHTLSIARKTVALRRALLKEPSLRASVRRRLAGERGFRVPLRVATPLFDTER
jgi:hypothetical protein